MGPVGRRDSIDPDRSLGVLELQGLEVVQAGNTCFDDGDFVACDRLVRFVRFADPKFGEDADDILKLKFD